MTFRGSEWTSHLQENTNCEQKSRPTVDQPARKVTKFSVDFEGHFQPRIHRLMVLWSRQVLPVYIPGRP